MKNIFSFLNVGPGPRVSFPPVWNTHRSYTNVHIHHVGQRDVSPLLLYLLLLLSRRLPLRTVVYMCLSVYTYIGRHVIPIRVPRVLQAVTLPINRKPYTNATAHAHAHTRVRSQTVF